jgi:hypothetical protein
VRGCDTDHSRKPTPGAIRAAKRIQEIVGDLDGGAEVERWARIIDSETGSPMLIEAAHRIDIALGDLCDQVQTPSSSFEIHRTALRAALNRAWMPVSGMVARRV